MSKFVWFAAFRRKFAFANKTLYITSTLNLLITSKGFTMYRSTLLPNYYAEQHKKRVLLLLAIKLKMKNKKTKIKRSCKIRPIFQNRREQGAYHNLIAEMQLNDPDKFYNYYRMSVLQFEELLKIVGPNLLKNDLFRSDVISPAERLSITLRYLAIGDHMISMSYLYRIGKSTVSEIIKETCQEIWRGLKDTVLKPPSKNDWLQIAQGFNEQWNFPNCIGALDGKHVVIQAPPHSGSSFYNYKGSHSMVMMALCDANYCFTLIDTGAQGRQSDGGIFKNSPFGKKFYENTMDIPEPKALYDEGPILPFVIVADEAFQLTEFLLRPYPGRNIARESAIYNYRHSRARRTIENTFGILTAKWRIFRRPINASVQTIEFIVLATACLHNFLKKGDQLRKYCPPTYVDRENETGDVIAGQWRNEVTPLGGISNAGPNTHSKNAAKIRNEFKEYFLSDLGAVPWQWERDIYR